MGTEKGLMMFRGRTLSSYALELLQDQCDEVLISSSHRGYKNYGLPLVADDFADKGPMSGIFSALKHSAHEWSLVLACDMPFVTRELIEAMLKETPGSGCCVIPEHHGFMEPLAALYHKRIIPEMEMALKENRPSLFRLFQKAGPVFLNAEQLLIEYPRLFSNLNSKEDLENLLSG